MRHCEFVSVRTGILERQVPLLQAGTAIKRKRSTIVRGKAEQLTWNDEGARCLLASKFLGRRAEADE